MRSGDAGCEVQRGRRPALDARTERAQGLASPRLQGRSDREQQDRTRGKRQKRKEEERKSEREGARVEAARGSRGRCEARRGSLIARQQ
eukprot:1818396-Rhodomonas_salina.5